MIIQIMTSESLTQAETSLSDNGKRNETERDGFLFCFFLIFFFVKKMKRLYQIDVPGSFSQAMGNNRKFE